MPVQDGSYERLRAAGCADEVAYVQACLRLFFAPAGNAAPGHAAPSHADAPALSVLFYVPSALSVPINAVIGAAWVGLKVLPAQL